MIFKSYIHKRSARNFLLYPQLQVKYAFINLFLFLFSFGVLGFVRQVEINEMLEFVKDPLLADGIQKITYASSHLQWVLLCVTSLMIFAITIVVTHRFLGPMIPMIRFFQDLEANKKAHIHLRKEDALYPLAEYLDTLEISVQKKPETILQNNKGFTVLEVLISLFILSIVMVGFAGTMSVFSSDIQKVAYQSSKIDVATLFRTNAKDYSSIYNSSQMPTNPELYKCLITGVTDACTSLLEVGFDYYSSLKTIPVLDSSTGLQKLDAFGNPIFEPEPVAGTDTLVCPTAATAPFPVFYTSEGVRCKCSDLAVKCPIQAISKFVAVCDSGATCSKPSGIKLVYQIRNRADLPANGKYSASVKVDEGHYMMDISGDADYYIKFLSASSFLIDTTTGATSPTSSLSESEIKSGKVLSYSKPASLNISLGFVATEPVSRVVVSRYVYPAGCTNSNLGQTVLIGSVSVNCSQPNVGQWVAVKTININPKTSLVINTNDTIISDSVVDYKLAGFNAGGSLVIESKNILRLFYKQDLVLSVTPPAVVSFVCDPAATDNTFSFVAKSFNGWQNVQAKLNPPGNFNGVDYPLLPGFETFNPALSTQQNIVVDSKYFTPGANYEISIEGTTTDGVFVIDKKNFSVKAKAAEYLRIDAPSSGSKIRTISDLAIKLTINLACGKTVKTASMDLVETNSGAVLKSNLGLLSNCVPASGAKDENLFVCSKQLTCDQWLGVSNATLCTAKYSADTLIDAKASVSDNTDKPFNASNTFMAGSKSSVKIAAYSVQTVLFQHPAIPYTAPFVPIDVQFSSPLLATERIDLKLTSGATALTFTCAISGSVNASYSNDGTGKCTLNVPIPASAGVYVLTAADPAAVEVTAPSSTSFKVLNQAALDCNSQPGHPVCTGGTTLTQSLEILGRNDFTWNPNDSYNKYDYHLNTPTGAIDAFLNYLPSQTSATGLLITFEKELPTADPDVNDRFNSTSNFLAGSKCTSTVNDSCPADYLQVPVSAFDSKRSILQQDFHIFFPFWLHDHSQGLIVIRQCNCQ